MTAVKAPPADYPKWIKVEGKDTLVQTIEAEIGFLGEDVVTAQAEQAAMTPQDLATRIVELEEAVSHTDTAQAKALEARDDEERRFIKELLEKSDMKIDLRSYQDDEGIIRLRTLALQ